MAEAIIYCDKCGKIILPSEIDRGTAIVGERAAACPACARVLTSRERKALRPKAPGEAAAGSRAPARAAGPAGAKAAGPRTSRRGATRGARPLPGGKAPSRTGLAVAGLAAGVLGGVAVFLLIARERSEGPARRSRPTGGGDVAAPRRQHDPAKPPRDREAKKLPEETNADLDGAAEAALGRAVERAEALASAGRFGEAKKAFDEVRGQFGGSEWFRTEGEKRIASILGDIDESHLEAARGALSRAREASEAGRLDEARKVLAGRAQWPEGIRSQAEELAERIASAETGAAREGRRKAAWAEFLIGMSAAGRKSLADARAYLDRERKGLVELGAGGETGEKLARIEGRFRPAKLVEDLAGIAFASARGTVRFRWKGEDISGKVKGVERGVLKLRTTRGRDARVPIAEIAAADIVHHSRVTRGGAKDLIKAGSYYLLRGDPAAARQAIKDTASDEALALGDQIDEFAEVVEPHLARQAAAAEAARAAKAAARAASEVKAAAETRTEPKAEAGAEGLVGHWRFDEGRGATARDSSGNRNHGRIVGARWAKGRAGGALDFDGGDDHVLVPRPLAVDFSRAFTVSLRVKLDSVSRFDALIGVTQDNNHYAFCLCIEGGLRLYAKRGGAFDATSIHPTTISPGVWYHVAAVMGTNSNCTIYVNGVSRTSRNVTQRSNLGLLHVGRMANSPVWSEAIDGQINDVRVYGRALSPEEVKLVFDGRPPVDVAKGSKATGAAKTASAAKKAKAVDTPARTKPMTFYVSRSSGNDGWTGTAASRRGTRGPWKTLARASTDYVPGDRILLKCGDTWNEELRPKGSGTPAKPITISSYGKGKKPIIDRQDYNQDRIGIRLVDQEGYKIVGLEFARCMTGIYAEYPDNTATKKFVWIEDCYFRDSLKYGDYKTYPTPRNIGLGICFFSYERDKRIVLKDITIKNCVFRRLASAVWTNSPDNFNKNASYVYNFGNMNFEDCLFEEGYQWQQGIRGVDKGSMRNCVTVDIGRGFRAWNGVAGSMFFRSKDWVFENCEWGFVDIGLGSADGEAFDFEGNCDNMTMRDCVFHDTDGPGFLLCCYASDGHPNMGIVMENCVLNGKSKRPIGLPRCEIVNTTDWNQVTWRKCRFYISPGEALMRVMDPEKDKRTAFVDCVVKKLGEACSTPNLAPEARVSASSEAPDGRAAGAVDGRADTFWRAASASGQWLELDFAKPTTVNEFMIREHPSSSVIRYVIQRWDAGASKWVGCFNGMRIGREFMAPIVSRTTRKVRLFVMRTAKGNPCIAEFGAYNDTSGRLHNVAASRQGE